MLLKSVANNLRLDVAKNDPDMSRYTLDTGDYKPKWLTIGTHTSMCAFPALLDADDDDEVNKGYFMSYCVLLLPLVPFLLFAFTLFQRSRFGFMVVLS